MRPGLYLHRSNRLEVLAERLAELLRNDPPPDPLEPLCIVVQTPGVSRWLSMRLADSLGCCLNVRYLFPRNFVTETAEQILGRELELGHDEDALMWHIHGMLPGLCGEPQFGAIARYLRDGRPLKRVQLAEKLARLYDQYAVYRPAMIVDWERGRQGDDWQAALWHRLAAAEPVTHVAGLRMQIEAAQPAPGALPHAVYLFGMSTLPPLYLGFLGVVGRHCPVHLLSADPAEAYWGDLQIRRRRAAGLPTEEEPDPYTPRNSLLAAMGRQGQEFAELLIDHDFNPLTETFPDPGTGDLLAAVQHNILNLQDFEPGEVAGPDESIHIVNCHGPMRETEVLRDHILHLLDTLPGLRPRDILVLTPAIDAFAPYIHAVFGETQGQPGHLPYSVADRGQRDMDLADAFLAVLALAGTRKTVRELVALLEHAAISARFEFAAAELETIRELLHTSGIRWGLDAAHRVSLGLPSIGQNTWQAGLDSLVLGTLMAPGEAPYHGIAPFGAAEGDALDLIGRLGEAMHALRETLGEIEQPRPLEDWPPVLRAIADRLLPTGGRFENERSALLDKVEALARHAPTAGTSPLDARTLHYLLDARLRAALVPHGFLSGGVTFAELKPMRSVPARVICLLGMNAEAFPRHDRPLSFDKVARSPKPGDRSQRNGDRYLFLETLLSAREHLYISYSGQSQHGGIGTPPSVVVQELLDHLRPALGDAVDQLVSVHPLQPFSARYFQPGSGFFSYSRDNCRAAAARLAPARPPATASLPPPDDEAALPTLDLLARFFAQPARHFLQERLGVRLPYGADLLDDNEPGTPDALENYNLGQEMLDALTSDRPAPTHEAMQARGALAWGVAGAAVHRDLSIRVDRFYKEVCELESGHTAVLPGCQLDVQGRHARYTLRVPDTQLCNGQLLRYRLASLKAKDLIDGWVRCLALSLANPGGTGFAGVVLKCRDKTEHIARQPDPLPLLADLLDVYWEGLCAALPFFPESSLAAASKHLKDPAETGLAAALPKWAAFTGGGDSEDKWTQVAFPTCPLDPPATGFLELAYRVWTPYLRRAK